MMFSFDALMGARGVDAVPWWRAGILSNSRRKASMEHLHPIKQQVLTSSLWLIKSRWVTVGAMVAGGIFAPFAGYNISLPAILSLAFYLLVANCVFTLVGLRLDTPAVSGRTLRIFNNSQIIVDWLAMPPVK